MCSVEKSFLKLEKIYNIVHDLKTPLASILGYLELLKNNHYNQQTVSQYHDIVYSEAKRLLSLIDSIQFSDEKSVNCCLNMVIKEIIEQNLPNFKKMNITVNFLNENSYFVVAPKIKIYRIFANIIENSIKYNKINGSIFIKIHKIDNMNVVKIRDTGIGICDREIKDIFNLLFRSADIKNFSIEGSGRGLAIVEKFIKSLSGKIEVKSQIGEYTEFFVYLPASEAAI